MKQDNKILITPETTTSVFWLVFVLIIGFAAAGCRNDNLLLPATGKPYQDKLDIYLGQPIFEKKIIDTGEHIRFPVVTTGVDGTVLIFWGAHEMNIRRSNNGGTTWEPVEQFTDIPSMFDSNPLVDENSGDILIVSIEAGDEDLIWRSKDQGRTWEKEKITVKPNEVMKWLEQTGIRERVRKEGFGNRDDGYWLRTSHGESGITLRYGENEGRLIMYAAFRPHSTTHPSHRDLADAIYSTAIYSDDGGKTWQVSEFFPDPYTEEAALAELHDGRIYYNSRSHRSMARISRDQLRKEDNWRRVAWSYDGGESWTDLEISKILPDGGGYGMGYGMMGGLVRLPLKDRDILIYSNTDTGGGEREKMTVWASFDGGITWPVKRLIYVGPSAYSSLAAGRPGTQSEGYIYLGFEGVETHRYHGIQLARFNLSWLLDGELTGDGSIPDLTSW